MEVELLIFAPHPDDAELGMGAAIATWIGAGIGLAVVDMSDGEPTPHGSVETRRREVAEANEALGLRRREQLNLINRRFVHDLASRHMVAAVIRRYRPRWIFAPYLPDAHPDHAAATRIIEDARFDAKLTQSDIAGQPHHAARVIYYYCTHLLIDARPSFVIDVSQTYAKKMAALRAYRSQFYQNRGSEAGQVPEMIRIRDRYFGSRVGVEYAEPFFCHEPVGLRDVRALL